MTKLTKEQKLLVNEAVTKETERCLEAVELAFARAYNAEDAYDIILHEIVEKQPFLPFNPKLKKWIERGLPE